MRTTRSSLALLPPTPFTVSSTLSLKPVRSTLSSPVAVTSSLSIVADNV